MSQSHSPNEITIVTDIPVVIDDDSDVPGLASAVESEDEDFDDDDFETDSIGGSSELWQDVLSNEEVAESLVAKAIEKNLGRASAVAAMDFINTKLSLKRKAPVAKHTAKKQKIVSSGNQQVVENATTDGLAAPTRPSHANRSRARILYFFEIIAKHEDGIGYQCRHISINMQHEQVFVFNRSNYKGLERALSRANPVMSTYHAFLSERPQSMPLTSNEICVAQGSAPLASLPAALVQQIMNKVKNSDFGDNDERETPDRLPWDNRRFVELLTKWEVAMDQPFTATESKELEVVLEYVRTHTKSSPISLPTGDTMHNCAMDMAQDRLLDIKEFIGTIKGNISLSLDAWMSSNGYAFLAIVMHYITDDWKADELLIDFIELKGEHSGENMADAVFRTMEYYNLLGRVIAIMADNASNNDTMLESIERRCLERGIDFCARHARMRCVPHVIHLAACKLLEALGTKPEKSGTDNYQDDVTAPLGRAHDDDAALHGSRHSDLSDVDEAAAAALPRDNIVIGSIDKLRKMICAVRASPQRRETWLQLIRSAIAAALIEDDGLRGEQAKMLILDVVTRWSSTDQMLCRAIYYKDQVDNMTRLHKDFDKFHLAEADWVGIKTIQSWLTRFRQATTLMSTTSTPILSSTHAILRTLQDELRNAIRSLSPSTTLRIRNGLVDAHTKLAEYHTLFDRSPYYLWSTILDPQYGVRGLIQHARTLGDLGYEEDIHRAQQSLKEHFMSRYVTAPTNNVSRAMERSMETSFSSASNSDAAALNHTPEKFTFTSCYTDTTPPNAEDEINDFFAQRRIPDNADPIAWWGQIGSVEYRHVAHLARDIFSIPGCAVAVERIFSGARDTIALRQASLKPDTIRRLMLLKQALRLERKRATPSPNRDPANPFYVQSMHSYV